MYYRFKISLGFCLMALGLSGCFGDNATGRYIAKFSNGIFSLQLAQEQNGQLSGQLDTVTMNADGKLDYSSFAASGVSNDGSISLTFKQSAFLSSTLAGSGTISGNRITLTGDVNPDRLSTVVFVRGTDSAYQADVNGLIGQANNIVAAKLAAEAARKVMTSRQNFANELIHLATQIRNFDTQADVHMARWPHTEQTYQQITAKMSDYLSMERQLAGNTNAGVKRGQIVVAINQVSISTDQLHNEVQSLESDFQTNTSPLLRAIQKAKNDCKTYNVITANSNGAAACQDIARATEPFQAKYNAFAAGLLQLEQVYRVERRKQEQLMQEADRLE